MGNSEMTNDFLHSPIYSFIFFLEKKNRFRATEKKKTALNIFLLPFQDSFFHEIFLCANFDTIIAYLLIAYPLSSKLKKLSGSAWLNTTQFFSLEKYCCKNEFMIIDAS